MNSNALCNRLIFVAALAIPAAAAEDYTQWAAYKPVTLNTSATGAVVGTNQAQYPLLVRLDGVNAADVFAGAKAGGTDLRFTKTDGVTRLPHHIDHWDSASRSAGVWVLLDTAFGDVAAQSFRMYWGNAAAADSSNGLQAFGAGYSTLYHLQENPGGMAPQFADASGGGNLGSAQGGAPEDSATAVIGKGFVLDGGTKYVSSSVSFSAPDVFTVSTWFKSSTTAGGKLLGLGSSDVGSSFSNDRHVYMDTLGRLNFGVYPGSVKVVTSTSAYNDGQWHLATARLSDSGEYLFVDGSPVASDPSVTSGEGIVGFWRAGYDNTNNWPNQPASFFFNGALDEVRVSLLGFASDWIKLDYETQKPGSACVSLDSTRVNPPSGLAYRTNPVVFAVGPIANPDTLFVSGKATRYSIAPALPAGITFDTATGVVGGNPAATSPAANYTVTATGPGGSATVTLNLAVLAAPTNLSYATNPAAYTERTPITPNTPTVTGAVTRYSVAPALPTGLVLDSATGIISGTPQASAAQADYVVSAQNPAGAALDTLTLTVQMAPPINLTYPTNPAAYPLGVDITPNVPTVTGSATHYSVNPALPAGLALDDASGMIWGNPSEATPPTDYTVTADNSVGSTTVVLNLSTGSAIAVFPGKPDGAFALGLPGGSALRFRLPKYPDLGKLRLEILDVRGKPIWKREFYAKDIQNSLIWDGTSHGQPAGTGIYYVRLLSLQNAPRNSLLERKTISLIR